ncbi:glycerophosphodiester phosphodiesterase [Victivallis sp. Marseille-Q1083]|uniref:glycerophosphodiester phosphodiesterase n=1 Tax=Victivallis sp. Marseille-Q1083 TaxID=2717288 RepID=UPI00158F47E7|nr:glycerophosphodiester phosphodiesterase [Victivallis sp. Marseille-Q1083]
MLLIAHRGESEAVPENTIESFVLAWTRGAAGIEGDFHLTKDKRLVCMHDDNALRTCGVNRRIADMTLDEICELDCGQWKSPAWAHTEVPTLEEVLETIPEDGRIYIELKTIGSEVVDELRRVVEESGLREEQLVIIAFDREVVKASKAAFGGLKVYWLTCLDEGLTPEKMVATVKELGADGVDCHATDKLTAEYVEAMHRAGLEFHVWTVDDCEQARRLIEFGVDSITTNRPYALWCELNG